MDKYKVIVKCYNCKNFTSLTINVGTTLEEFAEEENLLCRYCGCPIIKQKEKKEK